MSVAINVGEFDFCSCRGVLDTTLSDKVCQKLAVCRWLSLLVLCVSSIKKTDLHDITEKLLKVALNTIILRLKKIFMKSVISHCQYYYTVTV